MDVHILKDRKKNSLCGWVALMGPPNAGKSTLTNTLVGQKVAIVTSKPQTTRNKIVGILTQKDAQVIFIDTPGIHSVKSHTTGYLGKLMLQSAWQGLSTADSILLVLDGDLYLRKPEYFRNDFTPFVQVLKDEERPVIVVINKIDLFHDKSKMLPLLENISGQLPKAELFPISALRHNGTDKLLKLLLTKLPERPFIFPEDQLSTAPVRFMVSEIIREKLFEKLYQEVPYAIAVEVEHWDETSYPNHITIHAIIYVARSSHKAMVIGHAGKSIKAIGIAARKEIKVFLEKNVHLELWVKVREGWVDDVQFLRDIGMVEESIG